MLDKYEFKWKRPKNEADSYERYVIVGVPKSPFEAAAFNFVDLIGIADTEEEAAKVIKDNYTRCGGLLMVIDTATNEYAGI